MAGARLQPAEIDHVAVDVGGRLDPLTDLDVRSGLDSLRPRSDIARVARCHLRWMEIGNVSRIAISSTADDCQCQYAISHRSCPFLDASHHRALDGAPRGELHGAGHITIEDRARRSSQMKIGSAHASE